MWGHSSGGGSGDVRRHQMSQSSRLPDSPVSTWHSGPGAWALAEGLGARDHLRRTRCSRLPSGPRELLRGWRSTCSCPSWMRPTCRENTHKTRDVGHLRSHPQRGHLTVARFPHPGFLLAAGPAYRSRGGACVCLQASPPQLYMQQHPFPRFALKEVSSIIKG